MLQFFQHLQPCEVTDNCRVSVFDRKDGGARTNCQWGVRASSPACTVPSIAGPPRPYFSCTFILHLIFTYPTSYSAPKNGPYFFSLPLESSLSIFFYHDGVPKAIFSFPTTVVKTLPIPSTCPDPPANMTSAKLSAIN